MAFGADRSVKVALDLTVKGYLANLSVAQKKTADFSNAAAASAKKNSADWDKVGKGLLAVGAAAAAGVGLAVKRFADFDAAMSAAAAGTNATTLELKSLREAAIQAGADTQYSATEAAQAITEMGKAGVSTQDILSGGLIGAMNLAAAGQLEVGRAGEIAAVAMTQFGLSGKDIPHIADVLAAGAGKAMGSVEDLGTAFEQVAPIAASMGFSLEETTGILAEFAQAGLKGEKGGTGLRSVLLSLSAPSKIARGEIEKLSIELYDSQKKFKGAAAIADELSGALGPLDDATRNQALGQIFGNEAMAAATVLYKGGSAAVDDWTQKVNDAGFASRQAAKLTDNLKGDIERLGGSIDTVLIQGTSGANGPLRGLVQSLEKTVNGFGNLGPAGSQAAFGLAAVTAGVALVGGGALVAVPKVVAFRASLQTLQVSATRTGAALGYMAAAATKALAVFAVAEAATTVSSYAAQARVASVRTDELAVSLGNLGSGGRLDGALANLFRLKGGLLTTDEQFVSSSEVIKRFGQNAEGALGDSLNMRIGRMQDFGGSVAVFEKRITSLDAALAEMARSGNVDGAQKQLALLLSGVKPELVEEVRGKFTKFDDAITELGVTGAATRSQIDPLAKSTGSLAEEMGAALGDANSLGSAMLLIGSGAKVTDDAVKELAKTIQSEMDAASKAFTSDLDVLGKYDPAAAAEKSKAAKESVKNAEQNLSDVRAQLAAKDKRTVSDNQRLRDAADKVDEARAEASKARAAEGSAGLEQSYRASIAAAKTFTADISEVTRRGLDPQVVSKLLQEGPEKAAPALEALLGKNSANLIKMVNDGEAALAKINQSVVEQQRLTSLALNSGTDQMGQDLDVAMRIAQTKAAKGGAATAAEIAKALNLKVPEVARIAAEFGIAIESAPKPKPIPLSVETAQAKFEVGRLQAVIDQMTGKTIHIYAIEHIQQIRDAGDVARANAMQTANSYALGTAYRDPLKRAVGGPVYGAGSATSDSIPALLSNGEYVIKTAAVEKYGRTLFDHLNTMRFASGGAVGAMSSITVAPSSGSDGFGRGYLSGSLDLGDGLTGFVRGIVRDEVISSQRSEGLRTL